MNRYIEKIAEMSSKSKDDAVNTAVLGVVGGAETIGMGHLLHKTPLQKLPGIAKLGIGAAATLGLDYAGLRIGRAINNHRNTGVQNKEL